MATTRKNKSGIVATPLVEMGKLQTVLLSDIDLSYENQRTGDWTVGDSNDSDALEGNSFKELVDSIRETGQKDPVTVRPKGKKLQLIKGFRRYAALRHLAQQSGTMKSATINVIVKDLNDIDAFEEHVLENTARDNLKGSDLAFAAFKMQQLHRTRGTNLSGNAVAARLGKNQSYISMLLRIIEGAPKIAAQWREAPVQLGIKEMVRISKLKDPTQQQQEYDRLLADKPAAGNNSEPDGKAWVTSAIEKATRVATLLGTLEKHDCITVEMAWDESLAYLGVKVKPDATQAQINSIATAARNAYSAAKNAEDPPTKADESETAEPAPRRRGKRATQASAE